MARRAGVSSQSIRHRQQQHARVCIEEDVRAHAVKQISHPACEREGAAQSNHEPDTNNDHARPELCAAHRRAARPAPCGFRSHVYVALRCMSHPIDLIAARAMATPAKLPSNTMLNRGRASVPPISVSSGTSSGTYTSRSIFSSRDAAPPQGRRHSHPAPENKVNDAGRVLRPAERSIQARMSGERSVTRIADTPMIFSAGIVLSWRGVRQQMPSERTPLKFLREGFVNDYDPDESFLSCRSKKRPVSSGMRWRENNRQPR